MSITAQEAKKAIDALISEVVLREQARTAYPSNVEHHNAAIIRHRNTAFDLIDQLDKFGQPR